MMIRKKDYPDLTKTKIEIIKAFLRLLEERSFLDIKIQEIMDEAEYSRATFYQNFDTKEEVLDCLLEQLYSKFAEQLTDTENLTLFELNCTYYRFWYQHREILEMLQRNDLMILLVGKHENWAFRVSGMFDTEKLLQETLANEREKEFMISSVAAILWNFLKLWTEHGFQEDVEYLARLCMRLCHINE